MDEPLSTGCPVCGTGAGEGERFCERCGAPLAPPAPAQPAPVVAQPIPAAPVAAQPAPVAARATIGPVPWLPVASGPAATGPAPAAPVAPPYYLGQNGGAGGPLGSGTPLGADGRLGAEHPFPAGAPFGGGNAFGAFTGAPQAGPAPRPGAAGPAPTPESDPTQPTPNGAATRSTCARCAGRIAPDGYCEECGEPAQSPRDHWSERPAAWVGGVCDRGQRHVRNEDAMALAAEPTPGTFAALVVCDGVSTSPDSDVASLAAARAALETIKSAGPSGDDPVDGPITERMGEWSDILRHAAIAANTAIAQTIRGQIDPENPPSCTYVAAVIDGPLVIAGWIGDSRAYWIPDAGGAHQLSVDDSWAQEMIAQGVGRARAESAPQAHAITRWLGPDAPELVARTAPTVPDSPGWVLVCSDGLWNYCSPADDLAALVRATRARVGDDPQVLAGALVDWANAQGGRDNITAGLARFDSPARPDNLHLGGASPSPTR